MADIQESVAVEVSKSEVVDVEMTKGTIEEEVDVAKGLKRKLEEAKESEEVKINGAEEKEATNGATNGHATEEKNGHTNGSAKDSPSKKVKTDEVETIEGEKKVEEEAVAKPVEGEEESKKEEEAAETVSTSEAEKVVVVESPEDKVDSTDGVVDAESSAEAVAAEEKSE